MMRYLTLLAMVLAVVMTAPAMGEIQLNYLGVQDNGDGTYLHQYEGVRIGDDVREIRDLHFVGPKWTNGTITLITPNADWFATTVYIGPGQFFYNWQIVEGQPSWSTDNLSGFDILVDNPAVTQGPFSWTNNPHFPNLPDLGNVVCCGVTSVPVPEPATLTLLGVGGLLALGLFVRGRRAR